jgi:hypothetical protein
MRPIILFCVVGLLRKRRVVAHKWPPKAFCLTTAIPGGRPGAAGVWSPRLHATATGRSGAAGRCKVPDQHSPC